MAELVDSEKIEKDELVKVTSVKYKISKIAIKNFTGIGKDIFQRRKI